MNVERPAPLSPSSTIIICQLILIMELTTYVIDLNNNTYAICPDITNTEEYEANSIIY